MIFDFCVVFLKGSKYLIFRSEILSLWSPYRLTRKQARPGSITPTVCPCTVQWPLSSVAPSRCTLPGLSWQSPPCGLQGRTWPSCAWSPVSPLLLSNTVSQHPWAPFHSRGRANIFLTPPRILQELFLCLWTHTHTHVHRATCTHACARLCLVQRCSSREGTPEQAAWVPLAFPFPSSVPLDPWNITIIIIIVLTYLRPAGRRKWVDLCKDLRHGPLAQKCMSVVPCPCRFPVLREHARVQAWSFPLAFSIP